MIIAASIKDERPQQTSVPTKVIMISFGAKAKVKNVRPRRFLSDVAEVKRTLTDWQFVESRIALVRELQHERVEDPTDSPPEALKGRCASPNLIRGDLHHVRSGDIAAKPGSNSYEELAHKLNRGLVSMRKEDRCHLPKRQESSPPSR